MNNGQIPNMKMEDYHASDALGSSQLVIAHQKTLAHFKAQVLDKKIQFESKPEFDFGTCVHSALLDLNTDTFVKAPPFRTKTGDIAKNQRATSEWKVFAKAHAPKIVLDEDEYNKVISMFDALSFNKMAEKIISESLIENSFFSQDPDTGLMLKARPDAIYKDTDSYWLVDLKTSVSASEFFFSKSIFSYNYHIRAAHYLNVFEQVTKTKPAGFIFIVMEKEAPYCVNLFRCSSEMLSVGNRIWRETLNKISVAKQENYFPGYGDEIKEISLPIWAMKPETTFMQEVL